jgi:hypothetical protein
MNAGKAIAIILLTLFVFTMPLAALASNLGWVVYNQERVTDILISSSFSDEALPYRIRELVLAQAQAGDWGPGVSVDVLRESLESIEDQQWVTLFDVIMPENARVEMVERFVGGIYYWLDSGSAYPELTLSFGDVFANLDTHGLEIINWAIKAFDGPPCTGAQTAKYEAGEYGTDLLTLVSCIPPADLREGVVSHAASLLPSAEAAGSSTGEIDLTAQLEKSVGEEMIGTTKSLARQLRLVLPLVWVVPDFLLVVALALAIRSLKDLFVWARWPLILSGGLAVILALLVMNPAGLLAQALPAPGSISALAAAFISSLLAGLLSQAGRAMLWQMIPIPVIGLVFLVLSLTSKEKKEKQEPVVPASPVPDPPVSSQTSSPEDTGGAAQAETLVSDTEETLLAPPKSELTD